MQPEISSYKGLLDAIRSRRVELGLSQADMDHASGLADGYHGKIECGARSLGPASLGCVLSLLGLRIVIVKVEPHPRATELARKAVA